MNKKNYRNEAIAKINAANMSMITMQIMHSAIADGGIITYIQVATYSPIQFLNNIG